MESRFLTLFLSAIFVVIGIYDVSHGEFFSLNILINTAGLGLFAYALFLLRITASENTKYTGKLRKQINLGSIFLAFTAITMFVYFK